MQTIAQCRETHAAARALPRALASFGLWTLVTLLAGMFARPAMLWLSAPWGGLLAGLMTGALQWSLLGGTLRDSAWWIVATAGALAVGSLLQGRLQPVWAAVLSEALLGIAQWLVLRLTVRYGALWPVLRVAVAWPAASGALLTAAWLAARNTPTVVQLLAGAVQGAITGAATGLLLAILLSVTRVATPSPRLPGDA
jgi:hypothetical protein